LKITNETAGVCANPGGGFKRIAQARFEQFLGGEISISAGLCSKCAPFPEVMRLVGGYWRKGKTNTVLMAPTLSPDEPEIGAEGVTTPIVSPILSRGGMRGI